MIRAELDIIEAAARSYYTGGVALDVGSSGLAFRQREKFPYDLRSLFNEYVTFDAKKEPGVDVVGDAHNLSRYIRPRSVSFLICTSLLEHVRRPWDVVRECAAVTKYDGVVVFSVPWKYMDHPDPIDCWRISPEGMRGLTSEWFIEVMCKKVEQPGIVVTTYVGRRK
jgi:SAM-dependent methyltransferase